MITQTINLNLIPGGVLPRIKVSQYDKGSRVLQFNLFNGSSAFTIPVDASITIQGTKADHTGFQYSCTFSGSVVTADLEQQMTVFPGEVECEIRISQDDGDVLLGTCNFILDVEEAALQDDIIISDTELPLVEKAAEAADAAEASALDAEAWAVGQRDGEDVPADDPAYHNNSKYYAETVPTLLTNYYTKSETYSKGEVDTALGGKQDTLTFDDTPTSASSNPVKSGGVYTALSGKVNTEAGKGLSANDFTNAEKAKTDNAVLWSERKGYVGKNILKNLATSQSYLGVGYTVNADKSISLTAGTQAQYEGGLNFYPTSGYAERLIPEGTYILSDGGVGTTGAYLFFAKKKGSAGTLVCTSIIGEKEITIDYSEYDYFSFSIHVTNGYTIPAGGLTFYPMLRLSSIADSTYEPYLPSNSEIADDLKISTLTYSAKDSSIDTVTKAQMLSSGNVHTCRLDFTVGSANIAAWTPDLISFDNTDLYCVDFAVAIRDITDPTKSTIHTILMNKINDHVGFTTGFTLLANHRYQISFTYINS